MTYPKGAWQQQEATKAIHPYHQFTSATGLRFKDLKGKRARTARALEEQENSGVSHFDGSITAVPTDIYIALLDAALEYFAVAAMLLDEPEDS